eukprot:scaffold1495_cov362-Pavlova_lutheri.AAC.5
MRDTPVHFDVRAYGSWTVEHRGTFRCRSEQMARTGASLLFLVSCILSYGPTLQNPELYLISTIPASSRNSSNLLKLFVEHYVALGIPVDNFLLVIQGKCKQDVRKKTAEVQHLGVRHIRPWVGAFNSLRKRAEYFLLHATSGVVKNGQWVVQVDSDEFLSSNLTLLDMVARVQRDGHSGLSACFVDRVGAKGTIPQVVPNSMPALESAFPLVCPISHSLGLRTIKMILFPATLRAADHYFMNHLCRRRLFRSRAEERLACKSVRHAKHPAKKILKSSCTFPNGIAFLHHFKWHGDVVQALQERAKVFTKAGLPWYKYSEKFVHLWRKECRLPLEGCTPWDHETSALQNFAPATYHRDT